MAVITNIDSGSDTGATLKLPAGAENPSVVIKFPRRAMLFGALGLLTGQIGLVGANAFNLGRWFEQESAPKKVGPTIKLTTSIIQNAKVGDPIGYPDSVGHRIKLLDTTTAYTYSDPSSDSKKFVTSTGAAIYPDEAIINPDKTGQQIVIVRGADQFNYYKISMHAQSEAVRKQFDGLDYVYITVRKDDPNYKLVNPEGPNKVAK